MLSTAVVWAVYLTVVTEILGAVHLLTQIALGCAWVVFSSCALALWIADRRHQTSFPSRHFLHFKMPDRETGALGLGLGLLVAAVGATALLAPPNTSDAMDYHLPRVMEWMTYRSVQFFPTSDYQQLMQPPFAEYGLLHLYLLAGSDQFVNLLEWFSYVGSIIAASLVARQLGAKGWGQLLAGVFCATLPELVLESSGSMNTGVVAFWTAALVYFLLAWAKQPHFYNAVAAAAVAGLALLTKGTAYFFLPPLVLGCWWLGSRQARQRLLLLAPMLAVIALGLNTPQYVRNLQITGSILGVPTPSDGRSLPFANDRVTLSGAFSNVLRHAALEVAVPSTKINNFTVGAISAVIRAVGADPNDPGTTWPESHWSGGFELGWDIRSEVLASNPLHFVLLVGVGLVIAADRRPQLRGGLPILLGLVGAFILYSAMLRWQIYSSRQFEALFVVGAALVGLVAGRLPKRVGVTVGSLLLVLGLVFAAENELRPLLPWPAPSIFGRARSEMYFADAEQAQAAPSLAAASAVKSAGCGEVAVDEGHDLSSIDYPYVYPMMALLAQGGVEHIRFAGVTNRTAALGDGSIRSSCAVICLQCGTLPEKATTYERDGWKSLQFGEIVVYLPGSEAARP
ncbi:MAG: glycosyltransferase family 39 protein [Chloroflexota bacterium]|nr:glycosyltransferase family 39 protein [Chloroflexota bacterium]